VRRLAKGPFSEKCAINAEKQSIRIGGNAAAPCDGMKTIESAAKSGK